MTCQEREEVILRAHEAGAFDEIAQAYADEKSPYALGEEAPRSRYEVAVYARVVEMFAAGWWSRWKWRTSTRHLLEAGVLLGWRGLHWADAVRLAPQAPCRPGGPSSA